MGGEPSRVECPYCREKYPQIWGSLILDPLFWRWHDHRNHIHDGNDRNNERIDHLRFLGDDIAVTQDEINQANKAVTEFFRNLTFDPMKELTDDFVILLAKSRHYRIRQPLKTSDKVNLMIEYAKRGDFRKALKILSEYPCIVNYNPANRAWGIIHQAAYFNDYETMEIILNNPKCDPFLRTKRALDEEVAAGSTADLVAKDEMVKKLIIQHQKVKKVELKKRTRESLLTIQSENEIKVESILMMLNCFENVLHPKSLRCRESLIFSNLMLEIFTFINSGDNWKRARKEISLQLQSLDITHACFLATGRENDDIMGDVNETKSAFFSRVIHLYTTKCISSNSDYDNKFYTALNLSLLTHGCKASFVTGEDLALAAYGALLNSILMYWRNLVPTNEPTYRGMHLSETDIAKYIEGQTITWLSFNSSSFDRSTAKMFGSVTFMIDNSQQTKYTGKMIEQFSEYSGERECLFPSGAKFRINTIERKKGEKPIISMRSEDY